MHRNYGLTGVSTAGAVTRCGAAKGSRLGAVGWPDVVPDHISLWDSLLQLRREFDQYVNLRSCRLMPGVKAPLANRKPGDIDFWVVRENTEGEYSSVGGKMLPGTEREIVLQETVMTRVGVDRILKFAYDLLFKVDDAHGHAWKSLFETHAPDIDVRLWPDIGAVTSPDSAFELFMTRGKTV